MLFNTVLSRTNVRDLKNKILSLEKTMPIHTEKIFTKGEQFFDAMIDDIDQAKESIDLETYLFNKDELGKKILNTLTEAAKRGVKIRVLVDGAGTRFWDSGFMRQLTKAGAQRRVFHPFPWNFWQWSRSVVKLPWMLKWIYLLLKMNSRNHRKVCIIDDKIVFIGSLNISQCHISKEQNGEGWRDTGVRINGEDTITLKKAFVSAWDHIPIKERIRQIFKHVNTNPTFRLNHNWLRRRILYKNLLKKIAHCKQKVWITNAYFVPDNFLLKHLKDAAERGVDVRVLLPRKSDIFIMPWASNYFYQNLLKAGVRIFEYLPSMLHAKTLIFDDSAMVGSSNLNHRSLMHDLEVDVNLRLPESKKALEQQFLEDLKQAREIKRENPSVRPWYQRLLGRMALYLKYWI